MSGFLTVLEGRWIDDKRFALTKDLVYQSDLLAALDLSQCLGGLLDVPAGFVTDFASVPRVPVVYMLFGDRAHHESVVHDYLYQTHLCNRGAADKVFLEAMKARGKSAFVRRGMYWGVVLGGRKSYKSGPSRFKLLNE